MKIIKEELNKLPDVEKTASVVVDPVTAQAKEDSKKIEKERKDMFDTKKLATSKPVTGHKEKDYPNEVELPKVSLDESLFDEDVDEDDEVMRKFNALEEHNFGYAFNSEEERQRAIDDCNQVLNVLNNISVEDIENFNSIDEPIDNYHINDQNYNFDETDNDDTNESLNEFYYEYTDDKGNKISRDDANDRHLKGQNYTATELDSDKHYNGHYDNYSPEFRNHKFGSMKSESLNKEDASVLSGITANIKQLVSTQVKKYEVEKRHWWSDKHSDDEVDKVDKPLCFLYLDASGSCSYAEVQAVIKQVRDTFLSFTDKDPNKSQIDFEEYWFGTSVSKTRSGAGGGTNWGSLKEHISGSNEYKRVPDNIVIVTDGDLGGQHGGAKVYLKGAVWGLFVNSMDRDLCDPSRSDVYGAAGMKAWTLHVRGQKDTIKMIEKAEMVESDAKEKTDDFDWEDPFDMKKNQKEDPYEILQNIKIYVTKMFPREKSKERDREFKRRASLEYNKHLDEPEWEEAYNFFINGKSKNPFEANESFSVINYTANAMREQGLSESIKQMRTEALTEDYKAVCDKYIQECNRLAEEVDDNYEITGIPFLTQGIDLTESIDKKELEDKYLGKKIKIISMINPDSDIDDSKYNGRVGVVDEVDDMGQLHGSWGGLAVIPEVDDFSIID